MSSVDQQSTTSESSNPCKKCSCKVYYAEHTGGHCQTVLSTGSKCFHTPDDHGVYDVG